MDLSILLLTTFIAGLFMAGTGLIAAMVVLERPSRPLAEAHGRRPPQRPRRRRSR